MVGVYWHIGHPGTDFTPILLRHYAHGLRNVSEIVHDPGGQQLTEGHRAKGGMLARQIQLACGQLPRAQHVEVLGSQPGKLVEQRLEPPVDVARSMPESIVRLKPEALAPRKDDARTRHPVRLLAINQVSNDIERAERVRAFSSADPRVGEAAQ